MRDRAFLRLMGIVARRDYLRTVRRRGFLFATALLPLVLGLFLGLSSVFASSGMDPSKPVASIGDPTIVLVNESTLPLEADPAGGPRVMLVSRAEADARVAAGRARELYIVPSDYLSTGRVRRVIAPSTGIDVGTMQRREIQSVELAAYLRAAIVRSSGLPPETAALLVSPATIADEGPDGAPPPPDPGIAAFLFPYAFSSLFVLSIFITSGYLLQSVTEEKENRVVEIVLSSVPALPLMAGKVIGLGAAGLTQVLVWLATAAVAMPLMGGQGGVLGSFAVSASTVILAIVYFVLGYISYGAMFSAVGALAPGTREAQQYSGFFGMFAVIPLIFTGAYLTDPGSPIVTALSLIPLTAPASVLQLLAVSPSVPWLLVAVSLVILAAFTVLATAASARVFRATLLLYGTRPGVRDIVRAIFTPG